MHPNEGLIELNIDTFLPSSSVRGRRTEEMELCAVLSHLFLPHILDKKELCVIPAKYVWRLYIDILIINCDGNILDICALVIRHALDTLILPKLTPVVQEHSTSNGIKHTNRLEEAEIGQSKAGSKVSDDFLLDSDIANSVCPKGIQNCPVLVTVYLLPKELNDELLPSLHNVQSRSSIKRVKKRSATLMIADARYEEEVCASAKVSVSVDPHGQICGVHKYGSLSGLPSSTSSYSIGFAMLHEVTNVAIATARNVFSMLKNAESTRAGHSQYHGLGDLLKGQFELR